MTGEDCKEEEDERVDDDVDKDRVGGEAEAGVGGLEDVKVEEDDAGFQDADTIPSTMRRRKGGKE